MQLVAVNPEVVVDNKQKCHRRMTDKEENTGRQFLTGTGQALPQESPDNPVFFSVWVFFYKHLRITGLQGKRERISLTSHYHFHLLHRHLDISQAITAESSPLHIASSCTRTGNLWFPSTSS